MSSNSFINSLRQDYAPAFWTANILELFERLAFYGMKAVLVVYLAEKVGLSEEAGLLTGIFSGLIYSLPILAGVLVDRYGFRRTLMACFAIFAIGYFLIGMAGLSWGQPIADAIGRKTYIMAVLLLTAIGGSLIKPCIVGTVAVTTKEEARARGFSIYYTLVNFGGAIGPIIALQVRNDLGIEYVLLMSAFTCALMFLGTWFFFPEPGRQQVETRTFGKVFADMVTVFSNGRFILFLVIFSGFWTMFWQIFYSFPFYVKDVLAFSDFELLETVDAICIIFLTVPVAGLVKKWKPFSAMSLGFLIASLSWVIIGFTGTVTGAIIGVAVYAFGESMQAPRFYDYVSSLAPPDQVGTYMGFAFLPVAIGSFTAGPLADWLRAGYLPHITATGERIPAAGNPDTMWFILTGIGLTATVLMLAYEKFLNRPAGARTV